jgi:hypothetical protein
MLRFTASVVLLILLAAMPLQAFSFGPDLEISFDFGTEILDGFTQYELEFLWAAEDYYLVYGHSKLVYPIASYLTGGDIQVGLKGFTAGFGYWGQFCYDSTKMEDFDWLTSNEGEYLLLAFGATKPSPDMYYWQINFGYKLEFPKVWLRPFFKYIKYHSEFIMTDLDQTWYVNPETLEEYDPPQQFELEGQVLYYEQDLRLPLVGVEFGLTALSKKLEVFTSLGATLVASVDDYDDHIVRADSLEAWNAGSNGNALLMELGGRLNVFSSFWLSMNFGYKDYSIDTEGRQRTWDEETGQYLNAYGIDTQVSGVMRNFRVTLSYIFF